MGGLTESQFAKALDACASAKRARRTVIATDARVDQLEPRSNAAGPLLALRQPMAVDLRVVAVAQDRGGLERIADYAKNTAKRSIALARASPVSAGVRLTLGRLARTPLKDVLDAFVMRMPTRRTSCGSATKRSTRSTPALFRELLTYMMEDPRNITAARTFVHGQEHRAHRRPRHEHRRDGQLPVHGTHLNEARPKGDRSNHGASMNMTTTAPMARETQTSCQAADPDRRGRGRPRHTAALQSRTGGLRRERGRATARRRCPVPEPRPTSSCSTGCCR